MECYVQYVLSRRLPLQTLAIGEFELTTRGVLLHVRTRRVYHISTFRTSTLVAHLMEAPLTFRFPSAPHHLFVHHRFDLPGASVLLLWSRREGDADGCQQEGAGAQPEPHLIVVQPVVEPACGQRSQARTHCHRDPQPDPQAGHCVQGREAPALSRLPCATALPARRRTLPRSGQQ